MIPERTPEPTEPVRACLNGRCWSPIACGAFGYCREHNIRATSDYLNRTQAPMTKLIPFPRACGSTRLRDPQQVVESAHIEAEFFDRPREARVGCANGMPGHPECRSVEELEALLRASGGHDGG